ncbi:hypothetical protein AYI68_g2077 [Smittium mucronatum]|uniref:Uncharacterized protein n=1 Tax=Smittium mucronatum TaxID=133383 RepID=A0A1R0H3W4_9FUNG|nr:hypothetical protein AYI68_g2077 [Smittium mucronatum]
MDHWKSEYPELKKRSKSAINNEINLIAFKLKRSITSIKQTEKAIERRRETSGQNTVPKNQKNQKNQNFGIKFNDRYFQESNLIYSDNNNNEEALGSSEVDEMTIKVQKTSYLNKEVDTIINSMPNKPEGTQLKHLKGIISQSQQIISEKILISGNNKTNTASS